MKMILHTSPVQLSVAAVMLLCLLFPAVGMTREPDLPRVFIVHSYDRENLASDPQDTGLVQGFADQGFVDGETVVFERFFMDTKRLYQLPDQVEARGREALARIRDFKPDLVVTVDDNAARTVMLPLVDGDIPVVFTGINIRPEVYSKGREFMASRQHPGHNITGIYEKLHFATSLRVMEEIVPGLQKIVLIIDESLTGNAIRQQIEAEQLAEKSGILYTIRQVGRFDEYKQLIRWLNSDPETGAYYPVAIRLTDENGSVVPVREILQWTLGHVRKPGIAVNYEVCRMGVLGGVSVDFTAMGRQAGHKGGRILRGEPAGGIAVEDAARYALVFNTARARQLGLVIPPELLGAADQVYDRMALTVIPRPFHILIVQSNGKGVGDGTEMEAGLLAELEHNGFVEGDNLQVDRFYMQTRRLYRSHEQEQQQGREALAIVRQLDPDLVITLGDAAAEQVMLPLVDSQHTVLFGGIRVPPEVYNRSHRFMASRTWPGHNVSGVTGEFLYEKTLEAAQVAFPQAREIVLINSGDPLRQKYIDELLRKGSEACGRKCRLRSMHIETVATLEEFKQTVLKYNGDPAVDLISAVNPVGLIREDGTVNPLADTLNWLFSHQTKPGFTFSDDWVRYGYLMAAGFDFTATGRQLGRMAVRVLRGSDPADLPIERPAAVHLVVNLARARQLDIELPVEILEAAEKVYHVMETAKAH